MPFKFFDESLISKERTEFSFSPDEELNIREDLSRFQSEQRIAESKAVEAAKSIILTD